MYGLGSIKFYVHIKLHKIIISAIILNLLMSFSVKIPTCTCTCTVHYMHTIDCFIIMYIYSSYVQGISSDRESQPLTKVMQASLYLLLCDCYVIVLPLQLEQEQLPFEPLPSALQYIIHTKV